MSEPAHRTVATNGIAMHVAEQGEGRPVILCHGFPELWSSWRRQIPVLAEAGYRVVAPDQRGYGRTDAPGAVEDYDILHLTGDLLGLLDDLGEERAVFVGHDWGAIVAWQMALLHPERVAGVAGLSVPYFGRMPARPTDIFRALSGGKFFYLVHFQEPGVADAELDRDPRRSLATMYWAISGEAPEEALHRSPWGAESLPGGAEPPRPSWLSEEDLDAAAAEFARSGFTGPLNWYRNFDRNWELTPQLDGVKVAPPSLYVVGERDTVRRMSPVDLMPEWAEDLRANVLLPGCGHWTQQERPDEVNAALLEFLAGLD